MKRFELRWRLAIQGKTYSARDCRYRKLLSLVMPPQYCSLVYLVGLTKSNTYCLDWSTRPENVVTRPRPQAALAAA